MMSGFTDGRHDGATIEEWVFAAWSPDASLGLVSGHRINGHTAWYWAALARDGHPLLHVFDGDITVRADPFIVKGEALWAEHSRDAPMEQWSIGNETYAVALDDPADALGRAYGERTAIAFDIEWGATGPPFSCPGDPVREVSVLGGVPLDIDGYLQEGIMHGSIEVLGQPTIHLPGLPARRWHRWTEATGETGAGVHMGPLDLPEAVAHGGVRAPFAFPDGTIADLVLATDGWRSRSVRLRRRDP
jgi:hypothetical protein